MSSLKVIDYKEKFAKNIQKLFNMNVMCSEIEFPKKLIDSSLESKTMENIEYLIWMLKRSNLELYSKYNKEYNELLYGNNLNMTSPTLNSLKNLENSIKLSFITDSTSIISYLDNLVNDYLDGDTFNVTLNCLDDINDLLLKSNKNYNLQTERLIQKKLSLAYIFSVKENIDNIDIDTLEESYFSKNIKTIVMQIEDLFEKNIITYNASINEFSISDYLDVIKNDLKVENVLELIKNINFNISSKDKTKNLVIN